MFEESFVLCTSSSKCTSAFASVEAVLQLEEAVFGMCLGKPGGCRLTFNFGSRPAEEEKEHERHAAYLSSLLSVPKATVTAVCLSVSLG